MKKEEVLELLGQRYHCSQVLMKTGMEVKGEDNPDLLRVMTGLAGGLYGCGKNCGALTGGCAMFGLFAGRGLPEEADPPEIKEMVEEYLDWFEERFGSPNCDDILHGDKRNISKVCPELIFECSEKAEEILRAYGYAQLPACPVCGNVMIDEELADGKIAEVEELLEDK
ncbi:MAG: C_GCAxxG_C_C family protein [Lachnospiraceae bacterium]|nr:C_GCAxxG_C_C family protein [Lachnospiraceae bacterium]